MQSNIPIIKLNKPRKAENRQNTKNNQFMLKGKISKTESYSLIPHIVKSNSSSSSANKESKQQNSHEKNGANLSKLTAIYKEILT